MKSFDLAEPEPEGMLFVSLRFKRSGLKCPRLQCIIPIAVIHIDRSHFDTVLSGIADKLCRGIEAHRLAVEDGGGKHVRIVTFQPGGHVDQ